MGFKAILTLCALAMLGGSGITWKFTADHYHELQLVEQAKTLQAQVETARSNAAKESELQATITKQDAAYQQNLEVIKRDAQTTIANYQRGAIRLRQSLSCTVAALPGTATAASVSNAAQQCGLSKGDVAILVQFAADAEATRQQLITAQGILHTIYGQ